MAAHLRRLRHHGLPQPPARRGGAPARVRHPGHRPGRDHPRHPPARGGTALPGGFVDHREDWRHAVVRELREETGIDAADREVRLADAMSSPDGHLLLFGLLPERPAADLPPFTRTGETEERRLLHRPVELAFPLHTLAVRAWFEGRYI